jgi:hypothetical protein
MVNIDEALWAQDITEIRWDIKSEEVHINTDKLIKLIKE